MSKKLLLFDFDGTLYNPAAREVSKETLRALNNLQNEGHAMILVTGRGMESIDFIHQATMGLFDTLSILNGQIVYKNGRKQYENYIRHESLERLIELANKHDIAYGGYCRNGIIVNKTNQRVFEVWDRFRSQIPIEKSNFELEFPLYQGHLYMTKEETDLFGEWLDPYLVNWSDPYLMNLIPRNAGKAQAVNWCMEHFEVTWEETYAFGDGFNDHDLLLSVNHKIAMGNAGDELKAIADYVTKSVDDNGIEWALKHYGLI